MKRRSFEPLAAVMPETFDPEVIAHIAKFKKAVERRGAQLCITFPALDEQSFSNEEKEIAFLEQQFKLKKFPLLGTPARYMMPESLMFDTPYHLTSNGVERRTQLLIEDLQAAIAQANYKLDLLYPIAANPPKVARQ